MRLFPVFYSFIILSLSIALCSCGIKPATLDAPPGTQAEEDNFPRTYPPADPDPASRKPAPF